MASFDEPEAWKRKQSAACDREQNAVGRREPGNIEIGTGMSNGSVLCLKFFVESMSNPDVTEKEKT